MVISPNEVMRGCILSFKGKSCVVKGISDYIIFEGRKEWIGGSLINGEPITEEWLARLGFCEHEKGEYFKQFEIQNCGLLVKKTSIGEWLAFQGFGNQWSELRLTPYVHRLQVLYYALTGEHLKVQKSK